MCDILGSPSLLYTALRYGCYGNWASFPQQRVVSGYIKLAEDNNYGRNDHYLDPLDSDSTIPLTRADVYDRLVSETFRFEYEIWL